MSSARMPMCLVQQNNQVRTSMRRKQDAIGRRKSRRLIGIALVILVLLLGGLAVFQQLQRSTHNAITALKDSASALSVPTHVGQPAPKFTAIGVDGRPHPVAPGDGRSKVIVFYMGFG